MRDSAAVKGERILAAPRLGRIQPYSSDLFSHGAGGLSHPGPPGDVRQVVDALGKKAGESSSVEQILDDGPQVGPDDLAFPMGIINSIQDGGN
jgi:hypothetical protein